MSPSPCFYRLILINVQLFKSRRVDIKELQIGPERITGDDCPQMIFYIQAWWLPGNNQLDEFFFFFFYNPKPSLFMPYQYDGYDLSKTLSPCPIKFFFF